MKKRNIRTQHVGKDPYEREAYRKFLSSKFNIDKTEEDPVDVSKTDSSSFENENIEKVDPPTKKSRILKFKDFLSNNWVVAIVTGLIILVVGALAGGYVNIKVSQARLEEKISSIEEDIDDVSIKYSSLDSNLSNLDKDLGILRVEFTKDLDFIKNQIRSILK